MLPLPLKPSAEAVERYATLVSEIGAQMIEEWRRDPDGVQPWRLVKPRHLERIWREYTRTGIVTNEKLLDAVVERLVENTARLEINTILADHTDRDPAVVVAEFGDLTGAELESFSAWAIHLTKEDRLASRDDFVAMRISDTYKLLVAPALLAIGAKSAEEKAVYANMLLDVAHQRSDLAGWFVEGGTWALSEISGYGSKTPAVARSPSISEFVREHREETRSNIEAARLLRRP
ncbi:MAG: hypothetical protein ING19_13915 [Azospirillum sp.]|nr:hypothetical protein [Azospirillum sp.]